MNREKTYLKLTYILIFSLIFSFMMGCSKAEYLETESINSEVEVKIQDKFGRSLDPKKEINRIISLAPSNTEMIFALGLDEKLVGVTDYCDYPEEAKAKESVGSLNEENLEKILELEPDLVLVNGLGNEEVNKLLEKSGISIMGFNGQSIDEIYEDIRILSQITSSQTKAEEIIGSMEDLRQEILKKIDGEEAKKVFYQIWNDPLMAAGKGSFIGNLIVELKSINVAEDGEGEYPNYSLEALIEKNPQVYLLAESADEINIQDIKKRPGYDSIDAVRNDQVYIFKGNEGNIVSRPGPRIVQAMEILAKTIYPDRFE